MTTGISLVDRREENGILASLILLLSIFFHQSTITGLGNTSIADLILFILVIFIVINCNMKIPRIFVVVYFLFFIYLALVSLIYEPIRFHMDPQLGGFIGEYVKLSALLLYFLIGYILAKHGFSDIIIRYYSYTALFVALIGFVFLFIKLPVLSSIMFNYGSRFNGFMNDPNYFSILQVASIPYFMYLSKSKLLKISALFALLSSILMSGSKTGFIVLFVYFIFKFIESFFTRRKITMLVAIKTTCILLAIIVAVLLMVSNFQSVIYFLNKEIPISGRVTSLLVDSSLGISSDGSSREIAWKTGYEIIQLSPLLGVGLGNYLNISNQLFGVSIIAHNTYLQLTAEWGLPVACLFFFICLFLIIKNTVDFKFGGKKIIYRDILIIFLIGSFGISLNNARLFWLVLGFLLFFGFSRNKMKEQLRDG